MSWFPKLRFRYTLRTLLAAVTLFCVWLGWQVYTAQKLREAVALVQRNGGTVLYDYDRDYHYDRMNKETKLSAKPKEPHGQQWLRERLGDAYFNDVVEVGIWNKPFTDDELREVCRFTGLQQLMIGSRSEDRTMPVPRIEITDSGVAHLHALPKLKTLLLIQTKITNQAVQNLRGLPGLETLNLENNSLDDDCVSFFKTEPGDSSGFPRLKSLNLLHTKITDKGLAALVRMLPTLQYLCVDGPLVTQEGVESAKSQWKCDIRYYPVWPPPQ